MTERIEVNNDPLLVWREEFPILKDTTYMISHSLGPMPKRVEKAMQEFTNVWASRGIRAWEEGWWEMPVTCGDLIGSIIGAPKGRVVMHQNVSVCQTILTSCFDWNGKRNKLVTDGLNFSVERLHLLRATQAGSRDRFRCFRRRHDRSVGEHSRCH